MYRAIIYRKNKQSNKTIIMFNLGPYSSKEQASQSASSKVNRLTPPNGFTLHYKVYKPGKRGR